MSVACDVCGAECEWHYNEREQRWELYLEEAVHSHARCRKCGELCLWLDTPDGWRLVDNDGEMHSCGKRRWRDEDL